MMTTVHALKKVACPDDVPIVPHYAVIEFKKITEASGWGPENDSQVLAPDYYVTSDASKESLENWKWHIEVLTKYPKGTRVEFVALKCEGRAKVSTQVVIN